MKRQPLYIAMFALVLIGSISFTSFTGNKNYGTTATHYRFSSIILKELAKDTNKVHAYSAAATYLSFIGDYKEDLAVWDSGYKWVHTISKEDSLTFLRFKPTNAQDFILAEAKRHQIIMINEAHHHPEHRVFAESLLNGLYKDGFRYFGAETISFMEDTDLNERKYPIYGTGYYTVQPQFGNMIRSAIKEGFHVFAYEADYRYKNVSQEEREMQEAKHIKAVLDKDPNAKIVIYCGYGHLDKTERKDIGKLMAGWLMEYTGIEPFCIDQTTLAERGSEKYNDPYFKMIDLNYYAIFTDSVGNLFTSTSDPKAYNLKVYHPRTKWVNGRPDWVFQNGRQPYFIDKQLTFSYPCLLFAYYSNEDTNIAVPTDIMEIKTKDDKMALSLEKGNNYIIVAKDITGKRQTIEIKL